MSYHPCPAGVPHWGPRGAAGLLLYAVTADGARYVLLSHRSPHVQDGGTWSTPGGAIDPGESPWQAAVREAREEAQGLPGSPQRVAELVSACPHGCGWAYTTFVARTEAGDGLPGVRVRPGSHEWETDALAWVPAGAVAGHDRLHPGLSAAWPALLERVEAAA